MGSDRTFAWVGTRRSIEIKGHRRAIQEPARSLKCRVSHPAKQYTQRITNYHCTLVSV